MFTRTRQYWHPASVGRTDRSRRVVAAIASCIASLAIASAVSAAEPHGAADQGTPPVDGFTGRALFDGMHWLGWEGDLRWFRIEAGAIVGGSLTQACPRNEFMATTSPYADFELRVKAKVIAGRGNGGIQFRSARKPGSSEMIGYQADAANPLWGGVYDESRRNRILGTRLNAEQTRRSITIDGWNAYIIRCEGPRIRVWFIDIPTLDYREEDPAIPRSGFIALQIHEGAPAEVWYKDILLQELKPAE